MCRTKIRYETEKEARLRANRLAWLIGRRINPYKCNYCTGYHIGSWAPPGKTKKALLKKKKKRKRKLKPTPSKEGSRGQV
jgi:hypothetical protein